jgi:hypothetical protein
VYVHQVPYAAEDGPVQYVPLVTNVPQKLVLAADASSAVGRSSAVTHNRMRRLPLAGRDQRSLDVVFSAASMPELHARPVLYEFR